MASSTEIMEGAMLACRDRPRSVSPSSAVKFRAHKVEYSHRLTEKRRRDRMNTSMSEIAQLLPTSSVPKQMEKAEILEKTITYIKKLQEITGKQELKEGNKPDNPESQEDQDAMTRDEQPEVHANSNYYFGFRDCTKEVFHCLTNVEAMDLQQPCFQRLMGHLRNELQFMSENAEKSELENDNKDMQQNRCLNTSSNGGADSLLSSKSHYDSWQCKRSHESIASSGTQQEASSSEQSAKRVHIDNSSDGNGSSESNLSSVSGQGSYKSKKEKPNASLGRGNFWVGSGSPYSNIEHYSADAEKEKEEVPSSSNMFDRGINVDGSGCANDGVGADHKWLNNGMAMPMVATPISPRTPYIPSPYTAASYALHPSGTHFIPVVLHLNIPLPPPPLSELNGRLNSMPNGYMAALNCMRMGSLPYPYLPYGMPGMPFAPYVPGSMTGMNGIRNPKQEPTQKQCESKPREVDSSTVDLEPSSMNGCSTTD